LWCLVALLELVVPAVEVDVKHDDTAGGQSSHQKPETKKIKFKTFNHCL
jgi:hypothetical protein